MKYVCEKDKCAGCMACSEICPVDAIKVVDSIKSFNAVIDSEKCVNCNLCSKTCQVNNSPEFRKTLFWAQGWSNDDSIRSNSSSGGFATELMLSFIRSGGIVCSCCYDKGNFVFAFAKDEQEVRKFTGSKYIKSNPYGVYKKIKELLKDENRVLFLGLPCQVGGLLNYVGYNDNLYTVDLICHGTPSPSVLKSFLKSKKIEIDKAKEVTFRSGGSFRLTVDGRGFSITKIMDYYLLYFIKGMIYTDNCYSCQYARGERISDITVGDAWGSELPRDIRKLGVSLALCQTEKGKELLESADVKLMDIDLDKAKGANPQLVHPMSKPQKRDDILSDIIAGRDFMNVVRRNSTKKYIKNLIKTVLYKIGIYK